MTTRTNSTSFAPESDTTKRSVDLVRQATRYTINRLQSGYRDDAPFAVAAVARLRREAGRDPHASPTAWGLDDLEDLSHLRDKEQEEESERRGGQAAPEYFSPLARHRSEARQEQEELAVHLAVTLWALHQQSIRDASMHHRGWHLGRAVRRLAHGKTGTQDPARNKAADAGEGNTADGDSKGHDVFSERLPVEEASETIRKRFVRIGTSTDFDALGGRLRQLVLLLRNSRIPLDYSYLAGQLYLWQIDPLQDGVRRAWGREFHLTYATQPPPDATGTE